MQTTEIPEEGVTIGGPQPGIFCRSELPGVEVLMPHPDDDVIAWHETEPVVTMRDVFSYRREFFRVGPHVAVFYLPCDGTPADAFTAECEAWLREHGPEPVRLYLAQLADQRSKVPCLIRIPADRVAEILGL